MIENEVITSTIAVTGVEAVAMIVAVRDTGSTVDGHLVLELDLIVINEQLRPLPITRREPVMPHLVSRAQPGARIRIKLNPDQPLDLFIDWMSPVRA